MVMSKYMYTNNERASLWNSFESSFFKFIVWFTLSALYVWYEPENILIHHLSAWNFRKYRNFAKEKTTKTEKLSIILA